VDGHAARRHPEGLALDRRADRFEHLLALRLGDRPAEDDPLRIEDVDEARARPGQRVPGRVEDGPARRIAGGVPRGDVLGGEVAGGAGKRCRARGEEWGVRVGR
jgi:hypothetical protein